MSLFKAAISVFKPVVFIGVSIGVCSVLLSACLTPPQDVVLIPNAENIRMTTDGRIFVSGSDAVHEIVKNSAGVYSAPVAIEEGCTYYGGLAQLHDWMFSVCVDVNIIFSEDRVYLASGRLLAHSLVDDRTVTVATLDDFFLANGIDAIEHENAILIADEDFTGKGGVTKMTLDFVSGEPVLMSMQTRWIGNAQNVRAANGVRVIGDDVYLTDIDTVKRVPIDESGTPGPAEVIYQAPTVLDDLAPYCDALLVADFLRGILVYVPLDGSTAVESTAGFASPSAVLPVATPLFEPGQILMTLAGGLTTTTSTHGDRLVQVTADAISLPGCP